VTFLDYETAGAPHRRIQAVSAELRDGAWVLLSAKEWPLGRGINAEGQSKRHDELVIPSTLTAEGIRESFGQPSTISIWKLPDFIAQLERAGFSSLHHRVWFQSELARPLFLISMVLIASAFTMRHTRFGGTGLAILAAVLLGFTLYFVRSFSMILGENGQVPVALAVWVPPVASVLLAFGPLLHAEDG
jgi:lipopolysaccharide export system permease protein